MKAPMYIVWAIDVVGSAGVIALSIWALWIIRKVYLKRRGVAIYLYLYIQTIALTVFALSRSVGHMVKRILVTEGYSDVWSQLSPISGSVNSLTFVVFGAFALLYANIRGATERIDDLERTAKEIREAEEKYRRLMESANDAILVADAETGTIIDANLKASELLGRPRDELIGMNQFLIYPGEETERYRRSFEEQVKAGKGLSGDLFVAGREGRKIPVGVSTSIVELRGRRVVQGIFRDITERKRMEEQIIHAKEEWERTFDSIDDPIMILDREFRIRRVNRAMADKLGIEPRDAIGLTCFEQVHGADRPMPFCPHGKLLEDGMPHTAEIHEERLGGYHQVSASPILGPDGAVVGSVHYARDITERRQAEEKLRESEQKFRSISEGSLVGVYLIQDSKFKYVNPMMSRIFGYTVEELMGGMGPRDVTVPEDWPIVEENIRRRISGEVESVNYGFRCLRKDGKEIDVEVFGSRTVYQGMPAVIGTLLDVTERKEAEDKVRHHLDRITALRNIDLAIGASLDLKVTLSIFLEQVLSQLRVDAADVFFYNAKAQTLEYAAGRGFRAEQETMAPQRLGEGLAGSVALQRSLVVLPEIPGGEDARLRTLRKTEGFKSYVGIPLSAKGTVKGVLEIFQRKLFKPDREWLDFLDALAGQAAIAIDNATLFDELQRSNMELRLAYDTTIEGWSRALDYRDKETEGHSERVTDMTLRIARHIGMGDEDLVHVRRGALLHDIGKIGIPDRILLKPGKLTEDEWEVMRTHPVIAHRLLSPIPFLRPAIDIPLCHHEKWDGSGYPRGLKGMEIPLSARIFSVVDVWDALRSDRPYRPAWNDSDARKYIESLASKEFDPEVVNIFIKMKW